MAQIKLTPDQLMSQAASMNSLASEYDALFKNVNNIMKNVNGSWSSNLARNFSGKINSAQRSFSNVVNMLEHGASAASTSAETMGRVDAALAKNMGAAGSGFAGGKGRSAGGGGKGAFGSGEGGFRGSDAKKAAEEYKAGGGGRSAGGGGKGAAGAESGSRAGSVHADSWKNTKNTWKYLEKKWGEMDSNSRSVIEEATPSEVKDALKITGDIIKGEAGWKDLAYAGKKIAPYPYSGIIKSCESIVTGKGTLGELVDGVQFYDNKAAEAFGRGDYAGGLKNLGLSAGTGLFTVGYGSIDVLSFGASENITKASSALMNKDIGKFMKASEGALKSFTKLFTDFPG